MGTSRNFWHPPRLLTLPIMHVREVFCHSGNVAESLQGDGLPAVRLE